MDLGNFELLTFAAIGAGLIASRIGCMYYDARRWGRPFRWSEY